MSAESSIVTFSGTIFDPINPEPEKILVSDLAHALSNQCRFTGHVRAFYSVAEHSVRCAEILNRMKYPDQLALTALLHDASEAYLSDLARPIKRFSDLGTTYLGIEEKLEEAIAVRFGLEHPWTDVIKWVDNELLWAEIRDLMPPVLNDGSLLEWDTKTSYTDVIVPWMPKTAEHFFHRWFEHLTGQGEMSAPDGERLPQG